MTVNVSRGRVPLATLMKRPAVENALASKKAPHEDTPSSAQAEYEDRGDGLLRVKPYLHEYRSWVKGRWVGRGLLEVFQREFQDRPAAYYRQAIAAGLIQVDGKPVKSEDQVLRGKQLISHRIHRHEPPIPSVPLGIIHRGDDKEGLLVVDKPAGIPAHPSGRYHHLSLTQLLRQQLQLSHVSLINRLDRLTSGLVLVATSPEAAQRLHRQMEERTLQKIYLAEVIGEFPEMPTECRKAIRVISHKLGLNGIVEDPAFDYQKAEDISGGKAEDEAKGKAEDAAGEETEQVKRAWTKFKRLSWNGHTSIVQAEPQTGRTHQIRLHLQYLGYPIVNDPLYGPLEVRRNIMEEEEGKGEEDLNEVGDEQKVGNSAENDNILCPDCKHPRKDPELSRLSLNLHAWKYASPEWSFVTEPPTWATGRLDSQ